MTVTYSPNDQGQALGLATLSVPGSLTATTAGPVAALYLFNLSEGINFNWPLTFDATISSVGGSETFFIIVVDDPDLYGTTIPSLTHPASEIPHEFNGLGTASSFELARKTITSAGAVSFDLDLARLTLFMSSSLRYSGGWNGSLLLWLCASQASSGTWTSPSLNAYGALDRANRDTGRSGFPAGSRADRCPVTGFAVSRAEMVIDGYRGIKVHPMAYDPPEPDDPIFTDRPEED